jgi:hypothetical protein
LRLQWQRKTSAVHLHNVSTRLPPSLEILIATKLRPHLRSGASIAFSSEVDAGSREENASNNILEHPRS